MGHRYHVTQNNAPTETQLPGRKNDIALLLSPKCCSREQRKLLKTENPAPVRVPLFISSHFRITAETQTKECCYSYSELFFVFWNFQIQSMIHSRTQHSSVLSASFLRSFCDHRVAVSQPRKAQLLEIHSMENVLFGFA